ncbi:glycosyl hydrolase family 18 protein [Anaeromicropila herbilytica]|uniref:Glycosyl hydrolase family 18 n=1 Tax=Anaeromicropila herbilytica TaxID=2785025 RepID=A0A7R7EQA8_9FIRM|nr:glycosyl hydrolase family 18 protein [Anaeromicropila herbilytica]BCN32821.1 hypothetical protein bsdtb5_41160 [Anaeromicropila herbilytica]
MRRKKKQLSIVTFLVLIIVVSVIAVLIIKFTPSKKVMSLKKYFNTSGNEVVLILQDKIYDKKGVIIDGTIYVDYDTVASQLNKRFYWDNNENLLIYTTPTEIIKTEVGSKDYYVNKSKSSLDYAIVKTDGDHVYVALDYVKKFSNLTYEAYKNPNRVVVQYKWGDVLSTAVEKDTELRYKPTIKSDILDKVKAGDELTLVDKSEKVMNNFTKVITKDGIIGYIKSNKVKASYYNTLKSNYEEPTYSSITKDYKINLVWHQVTNQQANNNLLGMLENTKGLTTISPTWFSVISNNGEISSLASDTYVNRAHDNGIEVWALVDDFNVEVDINKVLSRTSSREKLINELIAKTIQYNLDGINVDFENIKQKTGIHYIEFIRELSVKCRNNGIVLSIDNYVPMPYSRYYDREEQGVVADYIIIMAYDEHTASSEESGSVSSIGYVQTAIKNTLELAPKNKIVMGIPFYTRLWKEVTENGETKISAEAYSMPMAEDIVQAAGAKKRWDDTTKQYYAEYKKDGATYKIWLEEEKSIEAKMQLINASNLAGVAEWRLGFEKNSIWNVIQKYVNK